MPPQYTPGFRVVVEVTLYPFFATVSALQPRTAGGCRKARGSSLGNTPVCAGPGVTFPPPYHLPTTLKLGVFTVPLIFAALASFEFTITPQPLTNPGVFWTSRLSCAVGFI